jgi:hypothetical protein
MYLQVALKAYEEAKVAHLFAGGSNLKPARHVTESVVLALDPSTLDSQRESFRTLKVSLWFSFCSLPVWICVN